MLLLIASPVNRTTYKVWISFLVLILNGTKLFPEYWTINAIYRSRQFATETQEQDEDVNKLKEKIANPSKIKLTKEQFLT